MKIAILAAGTSSNFPLFIDKPKSLYHLNGKIQLQRVIEDARQFAADEDIIVVAGYKSEMIRRFMKRYPKITVKVNKDYRGPAVMSLRTAVEGENDDMVFMLADESISRKNVGRICRSDKKMAIMCHDTYYYYSLGIMKLRKDVLHIINDKRYLSMEAMKKIYCFANNKSRYDGNFTLESGICLGYLTIDLVRRIGKIRKIENPVLTYKGNDIDFLWFDPEKEYIPDLDSFSDTDEYRSSKCMRFYFDHISYNIRRVNRKLKKIGKKAASCLRTHKELK